MIREVVTDPLDAADLWFDLRENIRLIQQIGLSDVRLFFGYSWGNHIYDGQWVEMATSPVQVEQRVADAERNHYGCVGNDNFYIRIPDIQVRVEYTYETDIHLSYATENAFVKTVLKRWISNEWMIERKNRS